MINEIANKQKVSQPLLKEILVYTYSTLKSLEMLPYEPEIVYRIDKDLSYDRLYQVVSHLVENTPSKYYKTGLHAFQNEIARMSSLTDWWNLIRLLEFMGGLEEFDTVEYIWKNPNFRLMMRTNYTNPYVLEALVKHFLVKEGPSVPRYIPREIAIAMLRYDLTPEGYPYLFEAEWRSREALLKSLQVLWVSSRVPLDLQILLMRNVLREDGLVHEIFQQVGILEQLYWNEDKRYFTQVWDLDSILQAVHLLLAVGEDETKSKSLINSPQVIPPYKVSTYKSPLQILMEKRAVQAEKNEKPFKLPRQQPRIENPLNLNLKSSRSVASYLTLKYTKELETPQEKLLYHIKHSKYSLSQADEANPFDGPNRVDILTQIFSEGEHPRVVQVEILNRLLKSHEKNHAIPSIVNKGANPNFLPMPQIVKKEWTDYPKVVTAVRLGSDHTPGKSTFLNLLQPKTFQSFQASQEKPQFLQGYCESFPMSRSNSGAKEDFLLLNLHGDVLALPPQIVTHVINVTSNFLIFCNPSTGEGELQALREALSPGHAEIFLYIDPPQESVVEESKLKSSDSREVNVEKIVNALNRALLRRGRFKQIEEGNFQPNLNSSASEMFKLLQTYNLKNVKSSLILQKITRFQAPISPQELKDYFEASAHYSEVLRKFWELLQLEGTHENQVQFLLDLTSLLSFQTSDQLGLSAWTNLKRGGLEHNLSLKRDLLPFFQKNVEATLLTPSDLLFELCKFKDHLPLDYPEIGDTIPFLASLFEREGPYLPIPCLKEHFFVEDWSLRFITLLNNRKIQVVSCLGGEEGYDVVPLVIESLFGPDFTSAFSISSWSQTAWAGCTMRLLHFPQRNSSEVEGLLLIQARPVAQDGFKDYDKRRERDRQIATFLLSISTLSLVFDWKKEEELSKIMESAFLALNRLPEWESGKIAQLLWIGAKSDPGLDGEEINGWLSNVSTYLKTTSGVDYGAISSLGIKMVEEAKRALELDPENSPVFNLKGNQNEKDAILPALSNAILSAAAKNPGYSSNLPDFLPTLGPIWDNIRNTIKFPYPDIEEAELAANFRQRLHSLLNLVDASFRFHVEDFPNLIYSRMRDIVNSWIAEEVGEMEIETKKEILWKDVSKFLQDMFGNCKMDEETNPCNQCKKKEDFQQQLGELGEMEWGRPGESNFTLENFMRKIKDYEIKERTYYNALGQQLMFAFEEFILQDEDTRYDDGVSYEFEEEQEFSLRVKIIPSLRRIMADYKENFDSGESDVPSFEEIDIDLEFLDKIAAWAEDQSQLQPMEASALRDLLRDLPGHVIKMTGYNGIYQRGMVRLLEAEVKTRVLKWEEEGGDKKLLGSFKHAVIRNAVERLGDKVRVSEVEWERLHNPLKLFLKRSKNNKNK